MDATFEGEAAPLIFRHGIPRSVRDNRKPYEKRLAIFFILASTLFERIAFYSLMANISLTLIFNVTTDSDWISKHSPNALLNIFSGTTYIATIVFAIISDAKLGRATTLTIGFTLYLIGSALFTAIASGKTPLCKFNNITGEHGIPMDESNCIPSILGVLICTAIGAGCVKSNLAVFGCEQYQDSKLTSRYFDKYAVAVNIGSGIATFAIPYILVNNKHYFITSIIAISMTFIATICFLLGSKFYIHVKPFETVVVKCIPVIINAFQSRNEYNKNKRSIEEKNRTSTSSTLLNASHSLAEEDKSIRIEHEPETFLDFAKAEYHGKFQGRIIDDVKSLRGAFIVFSLLVPYWLLYNQKDTTFQSQGEEMKNIYPHYVVPWMSLGDPVIVISGIIIFNLFIYKCLEARDRSLSIPMKLVIGMFFACLSLCIAGTVEVFRQEKCDTDSHQNLTIFLQLPQNIGLGFSQLFAMVGSYEYAYYAAPLSAQSLFMSLHFCSIGIASFIGVVYLAITSSNQFHLDFSCLHEDSPYAWISYGYFYILAGIQFIFGIIFIICQKKFQIVKLNPQQLETNHYRQMSSTPSDARI